MESCTNSLEERTIVDHCPPKILGARLAAAVAKRNLVRGAIVFDDHGVVHRNIRSALVKVHYRITARFHQFIDELIRP